MSRFAALVAVACLVVLGVPEFVRAQEQPSETVVTERVAAKPFSVGLLLGAGVDLEENFNPWGFGFGVRGGYSLDRLYFGARFLYQLGTSVDVISSGLNTIQITYNLWELSAEAGYDFSLRPKFTLRPGLLLGVVNLMSGSDDVVFGGETVSGSDLKLLISPGASIIYDLTEEFFVAADVRLPILVGGGSILGFVGYVNIGIRF